MAKKANPLLMFKYWFTSVWQAKALTKETKRPHYWLGIVNLLLAPLTISLLSILIFRGGFEGVDLMAYPPVILASLTKYTFLALVFSFAVVSTHKGSMKKMFFLATFPLAGYLFSVDASIILSKLIPNFPIAIVLKSLLILFVVAVIGLSKEETKAPYWASALWLVLALAIADFVGPYITSFVASLF